MIAAVIPAAGRSQRMGRPKLTLPIQGVPLIARVILALRQGGAERIVVVVPPAFEDGSAKLVRIAKEQGAETIIPDFQPPDMRVSVEIGLQHLSRGIEPRGVLVTPGDTPGIHAACVTMIIERWQFEPASIVVPLHQGRRGHPVLFPWSLALRIGQLPSGVGVNAMLAEHCDRVVSIDLEDPSILEDIDTPEDYRFWAESGGTFEGE